MQHDNNAVEEGAEEGDNCTYFDDNRQAFLGSCIKRKFSQILHSAALSCSTPVKKKAQLKLPYTEDKIKDNAYYHLHLQQKLAASC